MRIRMHDTPVATESKDFDCDEMRSNTENAKNARVATIKNFRKLRL